VTRRAALASSGAVVVAATILACSLRVTSYLQAGGGTSPSEAGPDGIVPGADGSSATQTATVVAPDQFGPSLLTQDTGDLYWVTSDGNVMAIKKDGSEPSARMVTAAGPGVTALGTTDAAELFYTKGAQIFTVPKGGGAGSPIATTTPPPRALAVDPAYVFAMAEDESSDDEPGLYRFQHDGGAPTVLRRASESLYMFAIALQGNDVFWDEGEGIFFSLPKDAVADAGPTSYESTGTAETIESALYASSFAVDENAFFYSDGENVRTHPRAPMSTANTAIAYSADTASVRAVAIDDRFVYAIETGASGTLRRNTKDAKGTPELMLDGLATPNSLAVDANAVYVALEGPPGAIVKCGK
jgi:hypothetical protein